MKRLIITAFFAIYSLTFLLAQNSEEETKEKVPLKVSGQAIFMTSTVSSVTGGYFNQTPAVRGTITLSKGNFRFLAGRNSDLIEPRSRANLNIIIPSYTKAFGKNSITLSTEIYLFDQFIDIDLFAPALTYNRKGFVDLELFLLYGFTFQGKSYDDVITQRIAISKEYAGFTFRLTGWNVYWGTHRQALALEVSKNLSEKIRFFVSGNLVHNYGTDSTQEFGAVRLAYQF